MALPFQPESIDQLRARFDAALETVFDYRDCDPNEANRVGPSFFERPELQGRRPGAQRKHVFDYPDGFRLIISRDDWGSGATVHVSGSVQPERNADFWRRRIRNGDDLVAEIRRHYGLIGGDVHNRVFVVRLTDCAGHLFDVTTQWQRRWSRAS